jgi:hypothetical protein
MRDEKDGLKKRIFKWEEGKTIKSSVNFANAENFAAFFIFCSFPVWEFFV